MLGQIGHDKAELFKDIDLISTDVFDTLLLRLPRSERSRIIAGEKRFARAICNQGFVVADTWLVEARLEAQRLAYRAFDIGGRGGEVRLVDIIRRQLAIMSLPDTLLATRLAIEVDIEREALRPNRALAETLRRCRASGQRIVAVSDIALPAAALETLITACHGPDLVGRIYSSADIGATKRQGDLFGHVLREEGIVAGRVLHIGDDETADFRVPAELGLRTLHLPRSRAQRHLSRANGGLAELGRLVRRRRIPVRVRAGAAGDAEVFGREILGPIVAEFCVSIWLYADEARRSGDVALLFCARGGLGIREAFERVLARLKLQLPLHRENLAISRLIAARSAVLARSAAALDELGREFQNGSFADVAFVLGGRSRDLPPAWHRPFQAQLLHALLDSPAGQEVVADIQVQDALFRRHLAEMSGGAKRIILCDTGLYGSTQRLLAAGMPDTAFETIQMARCNYKRFAEDHFPKVVGLAVERNYYSPFDTRSVVLRYWQLIESLFEPNVPSVKTFTDHDGTIRSNAGDIRHGALSPAATNPRLAGALHYIDAISCGAALRADAAWAWNELKRAITRPTQADLQALAIGARSVDFGRIGTVADRPGFQKNMLARLSAIRTQLWREGAIAREFPRSHASLLTGIETFHTLRGFSSWLRH